MILDTTSKSIQVVLGAAPATTQAAIFASYADLTSTTFVGGSNDLASNGTTAVTMVAAPAASTQRQVKYFSIYNADTVNMTVTVQLLDTATVRILEKVTLSPGTTLEWSQDIGFKAPTLLTSNAPDFIGGLKMIWNSVTSISVTSGEAWVPGLSQLLTVPATVTKSSLALTASTFYYVYLFLNGSTPDVEIVTTAPSSAYFGVARTKTGDTTRRYVGAILTDGSSNVIDFMQIGTTIKYLNNVNAAPFFVLSAGRAITPTNVACSGVIPAGGMIVTLLLLNSDTTLVVTLANSSVPFTLSASAYLSFVYLNTAVQIDLPLDTSQQFNYIWPSTPTGALFARVVGYTYER